MSKACILLFSGIEVLERDFSLWLELRYGDFSHSLEMTSSGSIVISTEPESATRNPREQG
ncbi:hypothetical protein GGR42_000308 [Saonia flava]|uniref:Uncharacterized protein n=1 Tax=Saonia flava TaxID=523696 RepID=A0A846QLL3_9FLAO|nr:hypothetical protein [Saonia flava]